MFLRSSLNKLETWRVGSEVFRSHEKDILLIYPTHSFSTSILVLRALPDARAVEHQQHHSSPPRGSH